MQLNNQTSLNLFFICSFFHVPLPWKHYRTGIIGALFFCCSFQPVPSTCQVLIFQQGQFYTFQFWITNRLFISECNSFLERSPSPLLPNSYYDILFSLPITYIAHNKVLRLIMQLFSIRMTLIQVFETSAEKLIAIASSRDQSVPTSSGP